MNEEVRQVAGYEGGVDELEGQRRPEDVQFELRLTAKYEVGKPGKDEASRDQRGEWLSRNRLNQQDTARSAWSRALGAGSANSSMRPPNVCRNHLLVSKMIVKSAGDRPNCQNLNERNTRTRQACSRLSMSSSRASMRSLHRLTAFARRFAWLHSRSGASSRLPHLPPRS